MPIFDILPECVTKISFECGVTFGASFVNVDFPANATGVGTLACDAMERIVKCRNAEKHDVKVEF